MPGWPWEGHCANGGWEALDAELTVVCTTAPRTSTRPRFVHLSMCVQSVSLGNLVWCEAQELAEKVKRQRDLYRDLLQEAGGDFQKATALPAAAIAGIVRRSYDGSQPSSNGTAETVRLAFIPKL